MEFGHHSPAETDGISCANGQHPGRERTSAAFVQTAIQNGLGRAATADEVTNYGGQLDGGESRFDFLNSVLFTDPAFQSRTNGAFVAMLYYTILVRDYDQSGFTFWLSAATNPPGMGGIYYVFNDPADHLCGKAGDHRHGGAAEPQRVGVSWGAPNSRG